MSKELIKPGTDNKPAGIYKEVGPRGGQISKARTLLKSTKVIDYLLLKNLVIDGQKNKIIFRCILSQWFFNSYSFPTKTPYIKL